MEKIAEYLKTKVTNIERNKGSYVEKAFQVRTDKIESKIQLFDYLIKYPLFGYKYFSQLNLEKNLNWEKRTQNKRVKINF